MDEEECDCPAGLPAWLATFADLMALLMCFFVLLLSFSEMDAMKFRRLAGSLAEAFGVQAEISVNEVPKGTSIIAQEFSPGKPDPTPINEIFQSTEDITQMSLEVLDAEEYDVEKGDLNESDSDSNGSSQSRVEELVEQLVEQTRQDAMDLAERLKDQIANGELEIETKGRQIVIRIREKGSFKSASAELAEDYYDVLDEIRAVLMLKPGGIEVQGHTDNIPIRSSKFRSNWDLSVMRAATVATELMRGGYLKRHRFEAAGFADVRPLVANTTAANRARNRRVEIVISQGVGDELKQEDVELLKSEGGDIMRDLDVDPEYLFELDADEVF